MADAMAERTSPATLRSQPDYDASPTYLTSALPPREGSRPRTESCLPHAQMEAESDPRFALEEETSGRSSSGSGLLGVVAAAHDDEGDSDDGDTELNRQPSQLSRLEDEIERLHAQKDSLAEQIEAILEIKAGQEDLGTPEPDLRHEGKRAGVDPLLLYVPTQRLSRICARPCRCRY